MSVPFELLSVEREGAVAVLTLQRPEKLNALNSAVFHELSRAFAELACLGGDEVVRAAILTGAGKAFVAGADIQSMAELGAAEATRFAQLGQRVCREIEALPFPVIAAVHGFALGGGCELALACDFIYAAEGAKLGQPEVTLGVIPGFGGTQRLAKRVGLARARELLFTGEMVTAEQALGMGLVNAVFPPAELLESARKTARTIAARGPLAVAAAKRLANTGESLSLEAGCELEAQGFGVLFGTEDQREGMRAFLAKQKHTFRGR